MRVALVGAEIEENLSQPEEDGILLSVQAQVADPAPAYLWRASGGELVCSAQSARAVWVPPRRTGRYVVTCAVQTDEPGLAVASFVHDVG